MQKPGAGVAIYGLLAVALAGITGAVVLHIHIVHSSEVPVSLWWSDASAAAVYPMVAAFLLRRRPENRTGWVLALSFILGPYLFACEYAAYANLVAKGSHPFADFATWIAVWGWFPLVAMPTLLPLLFPDGTFAGPWSHRLGRLAIVALVVMVISRMFANAPTDVSAQLHNPYALWHNNILNRVTQICSSALLICVPLGVASLVVRQRRARGTEREQLQWLMIGGLALVICGTASLTVAPYAWRDGLLTAGILAVPVCIVIAIVRHRLLDIEVVLNRAIAYTVLSALVFGAYVAAVAAVGQLDIDRRTGFAIVAIVALLAASARDLVQRVVDRFLFGERGNPYAIITRVGGRLDEASGPAEALRSLLQELGAVLKLPYVALNPATTDANSISIGHAATKVETLPVMNQNERIGTMHVGHRHNDESFTNEERVVLEDIARRAGALMNAARLVDDLQRSRERIVTAREEERRRLRHDIHDGLGPELAGLALQVESLAGQLQNDPALLTRIEQLRDGLRHTVSEVRRVVDGLRPPALDEHGLVEALQRHVDVFTTSGGPTHIDVTLHANELPAMSPAVEVAAYRIASEAITNAVRHSNGSLCTVALSTDNGALTVDVRDDGRGIPADVNRGVGLTSMEERATEVGGSLEIKSARNDGTIVQACLPLELR